MLASSSANETNPSEVMTVGWYSAAEGGIGRENERSRLSPHQIIRFAAAITIPVTNAAKQENSRRSSNNPLVIGSTPVLIR